MLADAIAAALPELRREAEARMTSTATILRDLGYAPDADGYDVNQWATIYTNLPCRIDSGGSSDGGSHGVTIGAVTFENATGVGHFPIDTPLLEDGDLVLVTSGEWPDEVYRIVAALKYDQKTSRKLPITEADRPEEWD